MGTSLSIPKNLGLPWSPSFWVVRKCHNQKIVEDLPITSRKNGTFTLDQHFFLCVCVFLLVTVSCCYHPPHPRIHQKHKAATSSTTLATMQHEQEFINMNQDLVDVGGLNHSENIWSRQWGLPSFKPLHYITMERSTISNGKIQSMSMVMLNSKLLKITRWYIDKYI